MTTASSPTRPEHARPSIWYWNHPSCNEAGEKESRCGAGLHSDQGFQYTSQAYGITPSMSRKGNPYDNAMAENFFSILKTECIYRRKPAIFSESNEMIGRYIHFYNHERIQLKIGETPLARRLST
ncbi:transposase [Pseudoflavonifractor phocaeensis]|uniref:transposase n=1 Tax=Pseudoflavonifractor phocaeensis TaxID=1870988 RepID=UPI001DF64C53|nr:transposase [Pseudoflavonifractor phocaeensis]